MHTSFPEIFSFHPPCFLISSALCLSLEIDTLSLALPHQIVRLKVVAKMKEVVELFLTGCAVVVYQAYQMDLFTKSN